MGQDTRLVLTVTVKVGKKVQSPARCHIKSLEELEQSLGVCLEHFAESGVVEDEDCVTVTASLQKPGFKAGLPQEIPVRPSRINDPKVNKFLLEGLRAQFQETSEDSVQDRIEFGVERVVKTAVSVKRGFGRLQAMVTMAQGATGSIPPQQALGAVRNLIAGELAADQADGGEANPLMSIVGDLLTNPEDAPAKIQGLLAGLSDDPELAPLMNIFSGFLNK